MLRVKLSCVAEENAARFARAMAYERTICRADLVRPLMSDSVTDCVWHQYVVRFINPSRDLFRLTPARSRSGNRCPLSGAAPSATMLCPASAGAQAAMRWPKASAVRP